MAKGNLISPMYINIESLAAFLGCTPILNKEFQQTYKKFIAFF